MAVALRPEGPNRERLCRTALRMFAERGYDGVSNREIVAACGLTKGAIYWYFESKEDLYLTVVAEVMTSFQQRVATALRSEGTWTDRLAAAFRMLVEVLEDEDDPHRDLLVLVVRRFPRGPGADQMIAASHHLLVQLVDGVVSEQMPGIDGRDAAALVRTAGLGVLAEAAMGRDLGRPALRALYRLLCGGELFGRAEAEVRL